MSATPRLWEIRVSHYSEKARWALAHKRVAYRSRRPPPGSHMAVALLLTRGAVRTFPLLDLDGERVTDSSRIVEALERRNPDPPLYPDDPAQRRRALAIEDYFDEEVGPHARLLAWHEVIADPEALKRFAAELAPAPLDRVGVVSAPATSWFLRLRYGVASDDAAALARERVLAGLDRVESELGDGEYLVGDRFSVADLTAAALLYPIVGPPEGPELPEMPAAMVEFRESVSPRPGFEWVREMFRRHRHVALADDEQGAARRAAGEAGRS